MLVMAQIRGVSYRKSGLDIEVAAAGIETAEQAAKVREMGCDEGQGTYFFEPLPAGQMGELLATAGTVPLG